MAHHSIPYHWSYIFPYQALERNDLEMAAENLCQVKGITELLLTTHFNFLKNFLSF